MEITWPDNARHFITGKVDAHLMPIVEVLGLHEAADFLMRFGGKYIYLTNGQLQSRNKVAAHYGEEKASKLFSQLLNAGYPQSYRVPAGKKFLARYLRCKGFNTVEIANQLSSTDVSVRNWLRCDSDFNERNKKAKARRLNSAIKDAIALGLVVRVQREAQGAIF